MTDTKAKEPDAAPWDIVYLLRKQAAEIATEGHNGWGITMVVAAEEIERLRGALDWIIANPSAHHMNMVKVAEAARLENRE